MKELIKTPIQVFTVFANMPYETRLAMLLIQIFRIYCKSMCANMNNAESRRLRGLFTVVLFRIGVGLIRHDKR